PPGNPQHTRLEMAELLFECYGTPKIVFGPDFFFSYHSHCTLEKDLDTRTGLIVSIGHSGTTVALLIGGHLDPNHVRRISYGGQKASDFLLRLLQCKYSAAAAGSSSDLGSWVSKMTLRQAESLFHASAVCAPFGQYESELEAMATDEGLAARDYVVQLPAP